MTKYFILVLLIGLATAAVSQYVIPDSKISRVVRKTLKKSLEASKAMLQG